VTGAVSSRDYLSSLELIGIKLGLDQIRALVAALDAPDRAYRSLVIGGTNGKGSVTAMVERGLRAAGYRTGRYTSPHLVDLEERVAIDGASITPDTLERAASRVRAAAAALPHPPSFFEATTALALDVFREAAVDVAVLEVGLGGRLDATNIVSPVGVAIASVDFDHQQYLGCTLDAIAGEKAGIIKPGAIAVLGENPPRVRGIVERACADRGAPYVFAPAGVTVRADLVAGRTHVHAIDTPRRHLACLTLGLAGRHQIDNAVTAVRLLEELDARGDVAMPDAALRAALEDVVWPARLERRRWRGHDVLIDGAHNPAGARALAAFLTECYGRRLPIVVAAMRDKDIAGILRELVPVASHLLCTAPATPRAADPREIAALASALAPDLPVFPDAEPVAALTRAIAFGEPAVVAGSLFLAGEIRAQLS
jgi:dihydrofolate synthase/folylpolyglutamate synthase